MSTKRGTIGDIERVKSKIQNNQREAWIRALKVSNDEVGKICKHAYNIRICLRHFHPSVLEINKCNQIKLKIKSRPRGLAFI